MGFQPQQCEQKKWGCQIIATEGANADWRSVRKQSYLLYFYRESNPLEDSVSLKAIDEIKSKNCTKAFILSSSGFTHTAKKSAENRPLELLGKEQLEKILDKAS